MTGVCKTAKDGETKRFPCEKAQEYESSMTAARSAAHCGQSLTGRPARSSLAEQAAPRAAVCIYALKGWPQPGWWPLGRTQGRPGLASYTAPGSRPAQQLQCKHSASRGPTLTTPSSNPGSPPAHGMPARQHAPGGRGLSHPQGKNYPDGDTGTASPRKHEGNRCARQGLFEQDRQKHIHVATQSLIHAGQTGCNRNCPALGAHSSKTKATRPSAIA